MKVMILSNFADKSDFRIKYEKGQVIEFPDKRAEELITLNLVEKKEDKIPKQTKPKE